MSKETSTVHIAGCVLDLVVENPRRNRGERSMSRESFTLYLWRGHVVIEGERVNVVGVTFDGTRPPVVWKDEL